MKAEPAISVMRKSLSDDKLGNNWEHYLAGGHLRKEPPSVRIAQVSNLRNCQLNLTSFYINYLNLKYLKCAGSSV